MPDLTILPVDSSDAGELLTLQRAAYVTEGQLYNDCFLPALAQTLPELEAELDRSVALKAVRAGRILGAVRVRAEGSVWHIGRLTIAPDAQGQGIGTSLMAEVELRAPAEIKTFALFTGHLSVANIRLYERLGYRETRREQLKPGVELVHLEKPATA
ncbi:MAG: GNAT family N-acetyltransferase [Catenulispora sp.]|nr:GNAT family N-acetyltransferase [Catenulispora sp.]